MLATPFRSAKELAADIRKKKIGCLELLDLYLARVAKYDGALNAIVVRDGYAGLLTIPPNVKYADVLAACHRTARESRRGLWALNE